MASLRNGPIRCGWLLMERDQLRFDQISRVRSKCSPFFPTCRVQSWWTFYHRSQSSLQHTMLKLFYPKLLKSILQQRQTIGTSKTLVLHDNVSVRKAKVTVTFLKEHNVQHLTHPPLQASLGSMWLLVVPPHQRGVGWVEIFPSTGPHKSSEIQSSMHLLRPPIKICLWILAQTTGTVCVQGRGECFEGMWML